MGGIIIDKKNIITIGIIVVFIIIGWNVFTSVPDTGERANEIRSDIRSITNQQQSAIGRVETIENGLDDSTNTVREISIGISSTAESINNVEKRIDTSENRINSNSELIAEGKSITKTVRERREIQN